MCSLSSFLSSPTLPQPHYTLQPCHFPNHGSDILFQSVTHKTLHIRLLCTFWHQLCHFLCHIPLCLFTFLSICYALTISRRNSWWFPKLECSPVLLYLCTCKIPKPLLPLSLSYVSRTSSTTISLGFSPQAVKYSLLNSAM